MDDETKKLLDRFLENDEIRKNLESIANSTIGKQFSRILENYPRWSTEASRIFSKLKTHDVDEWEQYIKNNPPSPGAIIALILLAERKFVSEKNSNNAKKPRADALAQLMTEIMRSHHNIKPIEMIDELAQSAGDGVIDSVDYDGDLIEWSDTDNSVKSTPFSALPARMSRTRKKLSSR